VNLQDKKGEFNLIAFCIVYGMFLIGVWIIPKKMGLEAWSVGMGFLMSLIMAPICYLIVSKVFD